MFHATVHACCIFLKLSSTECYRMGDQCTVYISFTCPSLRAIPHHGYDRTQVSRALFKYVIYCTVTIFTSQTNSMAFYWLYRCDNRIQGCLFSNCPTHSDNIRCLLSIGQTRRTWCVLGRGWHAEVNSWGRLRVRFVMGNRSISTCKYTTYISALCLVRDVLMGPYQWRLQGLDMRAPWPQNEPLWGESDEESKMKAVPSSVMRSCLALFACGAELVQDWCILESWSFSAMHPRGSFRSNGSSNACMTLPLGPPNYKK